MCFEIFDHCHCYTPLLASTRKRLLHHLLALRSYITTVPTHHSLFSTPNTSLPISTTIAFPPLPLHLPTCKTTHSTTYASLYHYPPTTHHCLYFTTYANTPLPYHHHPTNYSSQPLSTNYQSVPLPNVLMLVT